MLRLCVCVCVCVCALDPEFEPRSVGTNVLLLNTFSVVFPQKSILRPVSCWHHQNRPGSVIKISPGSSLKDAASMGCGRPGNLYFSQLFQVTRWSARCEMDLNRGPWHPWVFTMITSWLLSGSWEEPLMVMFLGLLLCLCLFLPSSEAWYSTFSRWSKRAFELTSLLSTSCGERQPHLMTGTKWNLAEIV